MFCTSGSTNSRELLLAHAQLKLPLGLMTILPTPLLNSKKDTRTVGRGFQSIFLIIFTLTMISGIGARLAYLQIAEETPTASRS